MKKLIVLLSVCVLFSSCVVTRINLSENNNYKVDRIDSTFFTNYNSMFLTNRNDEQFFLLSNKITNKDTIYNHINSFRKINKYDIINIQLIKIDSIKTLDATIRMTDYLDAFYIFSFDGSLDDDKIVWKNDSIKVDVFFSPQILDLYIRK